jgi:hypothetical protein
MNARKTGIELFHAAGIALPFTVGMFWQWAASDLVSNSLRGVLAEFLVAQALGNADGTRREWDACDLRTANGIRLEVKTTGYVQAWSQKTVSVPSFDIAPKRGWHADTNTWEKAVCRASDVYVFALHAHRDRATLDPLDVTQWEFYVLPTAVLDSRCPIQKRIGLASLLKLNPVAATFAELANAIRATVQDARCEQPQA